MRILVGKAEQQPYGLAQLPKVRELVKECEQRQAQKVKKLLLEHKKEL